MNAPRAALVLDTNIVLDLFVFDDPRAAPLRAAIERRELAWLASAAMREELARVLGYPQIARRLAHDAGRAAEVLARFDAHATGVAAAAKAPITCKDADDQKFVDLAVAHRSLLVSKDREVLRMARRIETLGALCAPRWP